MLNDKEDMISANGLIEGVKMYQGGVHQQYLDARVRTLCAMGGSVSREDLASIAHEGGDSLLSGYFWWFGAVYAQTLSENGRPHDA